MNKSHRSWRLKAVCITHLFCLSPLGWAEVIETRHLQLSYDPARPSEPIHLLSKRTQAGFDLSASAPRVRFVEGEIGGNALLPERIAREEVSDAFRLVLDYPVSTIGDTRVALRVVYALRRDGNLLRKHAEISVSSPSTAAGLTLEKVTLLDEPAPDKVVFTMPGWQSYPVFTEQFFFGIEFPAAQAEAREGRIVLSHAPGRVLETSQTYTSRTAVIGACMPGRTRATFEEYILALRPPTSGIHFNYNSWWTSPVPFTEKDIVGLIGTFHRHLYEPHGVSFDSFTIDMGWSARHGIWRIGPELFPDGFGPLNAELSKQKARLGLWCSPSNHYTPASFDNEWARSEGYETFTIAGGHDTKLRLACLARGTRYQQAARDALSAIARDARLGQMKFDGYTSACPESDHGHLPGELSREAKAEGFIEIAAAVRAAAPEIWMEATCFGFDASPWWLQHVDSVIGPFGDDAPYGSVPAPVYRESYTTSRDFYNLHGSVTPVPIAGQEVLGIIHQSTEPLYNDAVVTVLRGHRFISLYLHPKFLEARDYAFLAQLMTWARSNADLLTRTRILWPRAWREAGPAPVTEPRAMPRETYGYAHWLDAEGLICLRNPWIAIDEAGVRLDEATIGCPAEFADYAALQVYPYPRCIATGLRSGETLRLKMGPYETKVIRLVPQAAGLVAVAEPLEAVLAGADIAEAESSVVETVFAPMPDERLGDRHTILSPDRAARWDTVIQGTTHEGGWELHYLVEAPPELEDVRARIQINGSPIEPRIIISQSGWTASQPHSHQNDWIWHVVPVPVGAWKVEASVEIDRVDATVSVWLVRSFDPRLDHSDSANAAADEFALPVPPTYQAQASVVATGLAVLASLPKTTVTEPPRTETIVGVYLDRLDPISAEQGWGKLQRNRSVAENPLRIGVRSFPRGIGTHAPAKLVYQLDGRFKTFHGLAGQDAAAGGTITLEVLVDGESRWQSGPMGRQDEAREFHVPVAGAKDLTLVVTDGGNDILGDHADWVHAWLEE